MARTERSRGAGWAAKTLMLLSIVSGITAIGGGGKNRKDEETVQRSGARHRLVAILVVALMVGGCAEFSADGGMALVKSTTNDAIAKDTVKITSADDARAARARVDALLLQPITADSAVQVAILNNRGLQAAFNDLGISEAAMVEASLPPNPRFSVSRLAGSGVVEIEFGLVANILALFTLPARREIAEREFTQAQYRAVEATFRLAADTRRAYVRAVAAQELVGFLIQARASADVAADLMRKLGETGGASKLDQARAGAFNAEIGVQLAQARLRARAEREALIKLLGLWGKDINFKLPGQLAPLPRTIRAVPEVEIEAINRRIDLIMARRELDATAKALGLTEATKYVSLLELAGIGNTERAKTAEGTEKTKRWGLGLEIEIPIFDLGEVKVRRDREIYMRALNRLAEKAVIVRSEARSGYQAYRASYDIARQYQNSILPLRKIVSDEALLRYNGMLIDIFELLTVARESIASASAAIEAKRDYMLAEIDFQAAIIGGGTAGKTVGDGDRPAATATPGAGH